MSVGDVGVEALGKGVQRVEQGGGNVVPVLRINQWTASSQVRVLGRDEDEGELTAHALEMVRLEVLLARRFHGTHARYHARCKMAKEGVERRASLADHANADDAEGPVLAEALYEWPGPVDARRSLVCFFFSLRH